MNINISFNPNIILVTLLGGALVTANNAANFRLVQKNSMGFYNSYYNNTPSNYCMTLKDQMVAMFCFMQGGNIARTAGISPFLYPQTPIKHNFKFKFMRQKFNLQMMISMIPGDVTYESYLLGGDWESSPNGGQRWEQVGSDIIPTGYQAISVSMNATVLSWRLE